MNSSAFNTSILIIKTQFLVNKIYKKLAIHPENLLNYAPLFEKLEKQFLSIKSSDYFIMLSHNEHIKNIEQLLNYYTQEKNKQFFNADKKVSLAV